MKPGRRERRLRRRFLYALAAIVALILSGPLLPLELSIWFAGELLLYLEVLSGVWLTSRANRLKASRAWLAGVTGVTRRALAGPLESVRNRPALAGWIQWTFASA
jgi:hypothetical protein